MFQKVGLLALLLDVVAIVGILRTPADGATHRLLCLFVLILPFIGAIFYFAMGSSRRDLRRA